MAIVRTESETRFEYPELLHLIPKLHTRWNALAISDAQYGMIYFLYWQMAIYGKRFASRRLRSHAKPDLERWLDFIDSADSSQLQPWLMELCEQYQFLGVIPNVVDALSAWLRHQWALVLFESIPGVDQVLLLQTLGKRPVTIISLYPNYLYSVLNKENGFEFLVHDLEHAYKFFYNDELHTQQRQFFKSLHNCYIQGLFNQYLCDAEFRSKFEYLASDMNTHVIHSREYLHACLIRYYLRCEGKQINERICNESRRKIELLLACLDAN